jgi:hypothetical protein
VAAYDKNVYDDSLGLAHILTKINDNYKGYWDYPQGCN